MNPILITLAGVLAAVPLFASLARAQQEVGYIEQFALAEDRAEALRQLIPGTEEYYYFHALHYQNTRQVDELRAILAQWEKRFPRSGGRKRILNREALINYGKEPAKSLEYLRRELGLTFNHQRAGQAPGAEIPTALDPKEISWESFLKQALTGSKALGKLDEQAFDRLMTDGHEFTAAQRRDLLARIRVPDHPRLLELIEADLASKESRGFGEFTIHRLLTLSQLDELLGGRKTLARNETFVHTYLAKLRPGADVSMADDPAAREAYLERAWKFVSGLDPAFNSLKAHVLYQRLVHDRSRGVHDATRFLEYVKLPRNAPYIRPEWKQEKAVWRTPADTNRDYRAVTGMPPIGGDEPLVRAYLLHFLVGAKDTSTYAPYITEPWLNAVFAEAKIVNGVGDPERWASLLSPSAFQALKDRVDVEFDVTSPEEFAIDETVKLRLHIKNVETLLVKVFELNPLNYYLKHGKELSTDLELDGLVANHERTLRYDDPPQRRIARDFEFPEIANRRGVWVVEFIGGSKSSRAVVRKGRLQVLTETRSAGELITVLDEELKPMPGAALWFGGRRIACDERGRALVPFSTDPGKRQAVVETAGGFASLISFPHAAEQYALQAGIQVDREALRPGANAQIVVRPSLTVAGHPVSLERLGEAQLVLTSTDLDGVVTTASVPGFELASDREAIHEFRVPDRLASLRVDLRGKVKVASRGGEEIDLASGEVFAVNAQLRSDRVDDLYLSRIGSGFVLEQLGRSGEARGGQPVVVSVRRRGFVDVRRVSLKTNEAGSIDLGALDGIVSITAEVSGGLKRSWNLPQALRTQSANIHAVAGKPVAVPYVGGLSRAEVAFFAQGPAGFTADVFDRLALEGGFLRAKNLEPGDYRLLFKRSGRAVSIRVAHGAESVGHVFNRARVLELRDRAPAHLTALEQKGQSLQLQVANADALTRVHLVATRFLPDHDLFAALGYAARTGLYQGRPARRPSLYLNGRKIGDEFRYILERRYAQKFPGNMLERPELLLNPWAVRDTEAENETLAVGEDYERAAPGADAFGGRGSKASKKNGVAPEGSPRSIDFLRNEPAELWNLRPDKAGRIEIDLAALGDRQHVHVLVVDPDGATYRELALPDRGTAVRDLRLLTSLDPDKHFTEQDAVTLLEEGDSLAIPDMLTARFEVFDHLGAAYRYLSALREDATFREFDFLLRWPALKEEEKRDFYSRYASHELSFFLARKDPEFFEKIVQPYLANKKDKTFLDDYLLGAGLDRYLRSFEYSRLNTLERILLAQRTPDRLAGIRMDLRDRLTLSPPDREQESRQFEGALYSFGLSADRGLAVRGKLQTWQAEVEKEVSRNGVALDALEDASAGVRLRRQLGRFGRKAGQVPRDELMAELADLEAVAETAVKLRSALEGKLAEAPVGGGADAYADDSVMLAGEALYRALEATREWAENNYYRLAIGDHNHELIPANRFWKDFADHEGEGPFGSRYLGEATRNVHEMLLVLAVLDLPFEAPESKQVIEGRSLTYTAGGPALAFHREIREAERAKDGPPLLVSQSYFRHGDRHRIENGEQVDKFITDEFLTSSVYGGQVVVTNPTSSPQKLDVLIQIPRGAIPVLGHRATVTRRVTLAPYTTQSFESYFYFPAAGNYPCYPAHVSKGGAVVAHAGDFQFAVREEPTTRDEGSWVYLSQDGTADQVLEYLAARNLHAVDLGMIAWRCREDGEFFRKVLALLDRRGLYHATLFSYAFLHDHAPAIREFLLMQKSFLDSCGSYLASELITIDPIERRAYEHLEYKPLVNNRAHMVGGERRILNGRIRGQYQRLLSILSEKRSLDHADQLSAVYYLFLQDRVGEALGRLAAVNPRSLPTRLQFDYFRAYGAFYRSEPGEARTIAMRYADHPVDRWRERFATVVAQADEIEGRGPQVVSEDNREQQQEKQAAEEPTLELAVEGSTVRVTYRKVANIQVNYYEMDLEFLFSSNPFVSSGGGGFSIVRPNKSERLQLAADKREHLFELPREFQSRNVLVEIVGEGKQRTKAVYSNELQTSLSERYGMLTVRHEGDGRALPASYVKVYAMTSSGPVFYKDGYTDLRGKFDYASVSTSDIGKVSKFSILVMSDEHGATVLEAPVPQR